MFVLREFHKNGTIVNREIGKAYSVFSRSQVGLPNAPEEIRGYGLFKDCGDVTHIIWTHEMGEAIPIIGSVSCDILNDSGKIFERFPTV